MVEDHIAESRRRGEGLLREVWIIQVPNVGVEGHPLRHLLEAEDGVGDSHTEL